MRIAQKKLEKISGIQCFREVFRACDAATAAIQHGIQTSSDMGVDQALGFAQAQSSGTTGPTDRWPSYAEALAQDKLATSGDSSSAADSPDACISDTAPPAESRTRPN